MTEKQKAEAAIAVNLKELGPVEKGVSKIVAIKHMIDPAKGYRILLTLECGHEESIFKASRQPKIGGEQSCQTCAVASMKKER